MSNTPPPPEPTASPAGRSAGYGGWAIKNLRTAGGQETLRFDAVITRHGTPRLYVYNGGEGGCHMFEPMERGDEGRRAVAELDAWAQHWNTGTELAGVVDIDQFVDRLVAVAELNRMRRVVFLLDDEQYWDDGRAHAVTGIADRGAAIEHIRRQYAGRNARYWNRNTCEWTPVD